MRLIAAGYFGEGNLGDDALLSGFRVAASEIGAEVWPMLGPHASDPHAIPRRDFGVLRQRVAESDGLVFPGGSIFQDVTSWRSSLYYLQVVRIAVAARKPVVMIGQGVGPLTTVIGRAAARAAFNRCRVVGVRDPGSLETVQQLRVRSRVELGADTALLLRPQDSSTRTGIGLSMRGFGGHDEKLIGPARELISIIQQGGEQVLMLPMDHADEAFARRISHGHCEVEIRQTSTPEEFIGLAATLRGMIAMRLHAGILGAMGGCPPLMLSYDPKVTAFADLVQRPWADALSYDPSDVCRRILNPAGSHWRDRFEALRATARRNIDLLREGLA